jgi:hypothetical protein
MKKIANDYFIYLLLMVLLVFTKLSIDYLFIAQFRSISQAAVFDWTWIAVWCGVGLIGVWLSQRTGFPNMMDERVSNAHRFLFPILLGFGFGALAVFADWNSGWADALASKMGTESIHIPFPASALIYPAGSIIVEVIYRLLPVPLLVWLISNLVLRGKRQDLVFWIVAILVAAVEPVSQHSSWEGHAIVMNYVMVQDYTMNLTQSYLFRRYGFLAPLFSRVAFYAIWHVLWGSLQH